MGIPIRTDDAGLTAAVDGGAHALDTAAASSAGKVPAVGADPRLGSAVEDTERQTERGHRNVGESLDRSKDDSKKKMGVQSDTAKQIGSITGIGGKLLSSAGTGATTLLSGLGKAMPSMPQVSAPSAGQANPASLSNPAADAALNKILADDSSSSGSPGVVGSASGPGFGGGGGSGTTGPTTGGSTEGQNRLLQSANEVVSSGIPYAWGGGGPEGPSQGIHDGGAADAAGDYNKIGFDCSGLAQYLEYQGFGVVVPGTSQEQFAGGTPVDASDLQVGDLVFPDSAGVPPHHVQIYVGDGKVVEAQQSGTTVMYSELGPSTFRRYAPTSA